MRSANGDLVIVGVGEQGGQNSRNCFNLRSIEHQSSDQHRGQHRKICRTQAQETAAVESLQVDGTGGSDFALENPGDQKPAEHKKKVDAVPSASEFREEWSVWQRAGADMEQQH